MRRHLAILVVVVLTGCQYDPYAHLFTTTKPNAADVVGNYLLTKQRITTEGLSILRGQPCQLDLLNDGSFRLTNYPTWGDAFSTNSGHFMGLISTTGRWSCVTVGTVSDGRNSEDHWGVVLSNGGSELESLSLTGKALPYGFIKTYGDPDSGTVMIFEKKK